MKRGPLAAALLCVALGWCWQLLTVHFNYGGNPTALFCHGSLHPLPPGLAAERIYVFPESGGYDGQSYHYIAHDPLNRSETGRAVSDPSLRYPRILLPGLAHLSALGRSVWVDACFRIWELIFLGAGAYWMAQLLPRAGIPPMFAVLYVAVPVAIVSLDRMLVDLPAASLALGFAVYLDSDSRAPWKIYLILLAAALCGVTGFILWAAYAIRLLALRRYRRAALFTTALLPAVLWTFWVRHTMPGAAALGPQWLFPLRGMRHALLHLRPYRFSALIVAAIRVLWWVQFAGILLSVVLALGNLRKLGADGVRNTCFLLACLAIVLPEGVYDDPWAGARILAPMLLFQFLESGRGNRLAWLHRLPLLLVSPRAWLELAPQFLGILRGLA